MTSSLDHIGGTFIPNSGGPSCSEEIVGLVACCASQLGNFLFCLAICQHCCMKCDLGKIEPLTVPLPAALPKPALDRDYDNFNVVNGQIGFTTSEYGKFIPIVFGSDRLTGNVFWSSGFETKTFITTGEGGQETTYTYNTVSFALGICEGDIDAALRMWLGDTLIFDKTASVDEDGIMQPNTDGFILGMTVDLIAPDSPLKDLADNSRLTKISIFNGSETQLPEGVIVAEEGFALTPAYRGLAYILFENMVVTEVIPNIYIEVLANVNAIYPRLYGNLPVPQTFFDKLGPSTVYHDPSYDQIVVQAFDDSGAGDVPDGGGYAVFDGNRLDHMYQREIEITEDFPGFQGITPAKLHVLSTGFWLIWDNDTGSRAKVMTYDPLVGRQIDVLHSTGASFTDNDFPNGFGFLQQLSGVFFYPVDNRPPVDVFYGAHIAGHVGFATIDLDGTITMVSSADDVLPAGGDVDGASAVLIYSGPFVAENPTFVDGAATEGAHVYFFTQRTSGAPPWTPIKVTRATITGVGTIHDPDYTQLDDISFNEFAGSEYFHFIQKAATDPTDGCILLWIRTVGQGGWIAKWSPLTGTFVWKTLIAGELWSRKPQSAPNALLWGTGYWFLTNNDSIAYLDLETGIVEDKGTLTDQLLPAADKEQQFYNAFENSLTYMAESGDNQLVKVFLDRIARANVPLADIVTNLLQRVGVLETERLVDDLQALSLVGYTVTERKSLRTIFSELGQVFRFDIVESNGKIVYKTRGSTAVGTITKDDLGDVDDNGWLLQHQETDFVSTRKINLTYRDIDREYGSNVQSVILPKYTNTRFDEDAAIDVNVPVVLTATDAKALAEILLYSKIVYQSTYEAVMGPKHIIYDPGDVLSIETENGFITGRLRDVSVGTDRQIKMSVSQEDPDIYNDQAELFGVVGRYVNSAMSVLTPRIDPIFLQIPFRSDAEAAPVTAYRMYLTFLNYRVTTPPDNEITVMIDGEPVSLPSALSFPTWGRVITPLLPRTSFFSTDYVSQLTVKLLSVSGGVPASAASKSDLLDNPQMNLAYVNGELIQFETVEDLGDDVYRFTGLHRGCFGTEAKVLTHQPGENFVLLGSELGVLDEFSVIPVTVPFGDSPFKSYQVFMNTNNPFQPAPISFGTALNLRPWAVAAFKGEYVGDDLELSWERRTRYDGQWLDDGDFETVPLNELTETYDVYLFTDYTTFTFNNPASYLRKVTVTTPTYTYTDAEQTADGFDRSTEDVYVMVNQNGSYTGKDAGTAFTRRVEYQR